MIIKLFSGSWQIRHYLIFVNKINESENMYDSFFMNVLGSDPMHHPSSWWIIIGHESKWGGLFFPNHFYFLFLICFTWHERWWWWWVCHTCTPSQLFCGSHVNPVDITTSCTPSYPWISLLHFSLIYSF